MPATEVSATDDRKAQPTNGLPAVKPHCCNLHLVRALNPLIRVRKRAY